MIVGIDLGTTHSLIGYHGPNGPQLIPNALGELLTPSVVSADADGHMLIGRAARDRDFGLVILNRRVLLDAANRHRGIAFDDRRKVAVRGPIVLVKPSDRHAHCRKFQLAKAGLDLDTVQAHAPGERLGLFAMRPMEGEGYSTGELDQIDNEIDEVAWQLRKLAKIEVEQGEDADALSERLEHWLEAA